MDEREIIRGRPYGGVAIVWYSNLRSKVTPILNDNKRFCALQIDINNKSILLICAYMPCDDRCRDRNVNEFVDILNDIAIIVNTHNPDYVCLGGDFNTDLQRATAHTHNLISFANNYNLNFCVNDVSCTFDFTYRSKGSGHTSFIDHFILSDNLYDALLTFDNVDSVNNFSDHIPVKCVIDYVMSYSENVNPVCNQSRPAWKKATVNQLSNYSQLLDEILGEIHVPFDAIQCNDIFCNLHNDAICKFHDDIIDSMISACNDAIACYGSQVYKNITGWNMYVDKYFKSALVWHKIWKENGQPESGLLAEIRRSTRSQYHKAYRMVISHEKVIRANNIENAFDNYSFEGMWSEIRSCNSRPAKIPVSVDGLSGRSEIAEHFADKFRTLYNSVGYTDDDLNKLKQLLHNKISTVCNCGHCSYFNYHCICTNDVVEAIKELKRNKSDGEGQLMSDHVINGSNKLNIYWFFIYCSSSSWILSRRCDYGDNGPSD